MSQSDMHGKWPWIISLHVHAAGLGLLVYFGARELARRDDETPPLFVLQSGVTRVESAASVHANSRRPMVRVERHLPIEPEPQEINVDRRVPIELPTRPAAVLATVDATPPYAEFDVPPLPAEQPAIVTADDPPSRPKLLSEPLPPIETPSVTSSPATANSASLGAVDVVPSPFPSNPNPAYPGDAFRAGIEGVVLLRVVVGADGRPAEVTLEATSGNVSLDHAAIRGVRERWRFRPARRGNQFVPYAVFLPVRFDHPNVGT